MTKPARGGWKWLAVIVLAVAPGVVFGTMLTTSGRSGSGGHGLLSGSVAAGAPPDAGPLQQQIIEVVGKAIPAQSRTF